MTAVFAGLAAGGVHVLSGPDHLAALSPLSIVEKEDSWVSGLKWGIGHTTGVLIIGFLALAFREVLPIESISSISERLVGIVLIGIGLWGIHKSVHQHVHVHEHEHGEITHEHVHVHGKPHDHPKPHSHSHAAVLIGVLHGTAGGSHLFGVLPALVLPNILEATTYLVAFGIGTIIAMVFFTGSLGILSARFVRHSGAFYKRLLMTTSLAAIAIGGFWLFL